MQGDQLDLLAAAQAPVDELTRTQALLALLDQWQLNGWLRPLDRALVDFLLEQSAGCAPPVLLGAALVSHQLGHGHVCLDLQATLEEPDLALSLPPDGDEVSSSLLPSQLLAELSLEDWQQALQRSDVVDADASAGGNRPLVLVGKRLYLRRYWQYERKVVNALRRRLSTPMQMHSYKAY